jgi:hypothetical protein
MLGVLSAALATLFSHWASENASEAINLRLAARRAAHELGASVRLRGGRGRAPSSHASAHAATNGPRAGA